jgi:hypothetical protein
MSQVVGQEAGALTRTAARGLAAEGRIGPTLSASAKAALNPVAIGQDVAAGWRYMTNPAARGAANALVGEAFSAAGSNPRALFAASQADLGLTRAIVANTQIAPEFAAASATTSHALAVASRFQLGSVASVAYGAYDVTFGTQATIEGVSGDYTAPIVEPFQWVSSFWGPTPAERLHLPQ